MPIKVFLSLILVSLLAYNWQENNPHGLIIPDRYLIYFDHIAQEIRFLDLQTGNVDKKIYIDRNVRPGGAINEQGFSHTWFYEQDTQYIYLMERSHRLTKVYQINIKYLTVTEIFRIDSYIFKLFVDDNYLYLLNFVDPPLPNENSNVEQNFIIKHNLLTRENTIINFNRLLPEDQKVHAPEFFVFENSIIFEGYRNRNEIVLRKLYVYNTVENTIKLIDQFTNYFSISNGLILYSKNDLEVVIENDGSSVVILYPRVTFYTFNLKNKDTKTLPHQIDSWVFRGFLLIDTNTFIFSTPQKIPPNIYDEYRVFLGVEERYDDYYIANINVDEMVFLFSARDIRLLGSKSRINDMDTSHNKR